MKRILTDKILRGDNLLEIFPYVDVILPVYNASETIKESIESVLGQSYRNFILYIIDDGSTDGTEDICKKYLSDSRVRYFKKDHEGISKALNFGIIQGSSDYIARQDADDIWLEDHLKVMISFMLEYPEIDIAGSSVFVERGQIREGIIIHGNECFSGYDLWLELAYKNPFNHSTVIYKRDILRNTGIYDSYFDGIEDWHLWSRIVTKNNAAILPISSVFYRLPETYFRDMTFRHKLAFTRKLSLKEVLGNG